MFIACVKNHGIDYLQVMEYYSVMENGKSKAKQRSVKSLGPLARFDDGRPDYLRRLRQSFRDGSPIITELEDLTGASAVPEATMIAFDKTSDEDCFSDPKNIGYFVLDALFDELGVYDVLNKHKSQKGVGYDLVGIAKLLVFGRVMRPDSKLGTFEDKGCYLFPITQCADLNEVYAALDELYASSCAIQKRMDTKMKATLGRSSEICYYDVTNYWFEIKQTDRDKIDAKGGVVKEGMRKPGPSKAKNRKPIVQMGLFTDEHAIPLSFHLFPGNHIDQTTLRPTMRETLDEMGFERVIVVADGGVNSGKNIAHILSEGDGYVFSKSAKGSDRATKAWIVDEEGYVSNARGTFKSKSKIRERTIEAEDGAKRKITEKIVCYWSYGHYLRACKENESFLAWAKEAREHPDKLKDKQSNRQKYLKKTKTDKKTGEVLEDAIDVLSLDWNKIEQDRALMGYYTIMTSETKMSDADIIERYHGLGRIEDAFRTLKSDFEGRPVFVYTPEHIDAHFLICYIALVMVRILQHRVLTYLGKDTAATSGWEFGLTSARIKEALAGFTADHLAQGFYRLSRPTDDLDLLMDALGIDAHLRIPELKDLRQLKHTTDKAGLCK
jgi:hypothetical protein